MSTGFSLPTCGQHASAFSTNRLQASAAVHPHLKGPVAEVYGWRQVHLAVKVLAAAVACTRRH